MARREITDEDHREAIRRLLVGMAAGRDAVELSAAVVDLHPKNDTFPGEVYMRIAAEVLADAVAAGGRVEYEGLRERHLDEVVWWGTDDFWRYGLLAAVAIVRASAEVRGTTESQIVAELADCHGVSLPEPPTNE